MKIPTLLTAPLLLLPSLLPSLAETIDAETCLGTEKECLNAENEEEEWAPPFPDCTLYLADFSSVPGAKFGVFTTEDLPEGAPIGEPELFIPILDKYKTLPYRGQHRWLSWLKYVRGPTKYKNNENKAKHNLTWEDTHHESNVVQLYDDLQYIDAFAPGLQAVTASNNKLANVKQKDAKHSLQKDSAGLKYGKDVGMGAFTKHYGVTFAASKDIPAGGEIIMNVDDTMDYGVKHEEEDDEEDEEEEEEEEDDEEERKVKSEDENLKVELEDPDELKLGAMCIDNLRVGDSTVPQAGRGAFAKHFIPKGMLITPSFAAVLKRQDLAMYETNETAYFYRTTVNKDKVVGTELVTNYCYGHPNSSLLILPTAPIVNFINHNSKSPNAEISWPGSNTKEGPNWFKSHPVEMIDMSGKILMGFFASRDIEPGEEIFLDYGKDWEEAWNKHVNDWSPNDEEYVSAEEYLESGAFEVRTPEEQKEKPYPSNLLLVCNFTHPQDYDDTREQRNCVLPCDIESRKVIDGKTYYIAYFSAHSRATDARRMLYHDCNFKEDELVAEFLPAESISVVDKEESTTMASAFRHEIGVPEGFFPELWMEPAEYEIADPGPLKAGEVVSMVWKHNGKQVTNNAYFIGVPKNFSANMYAYMDRMKIVDTFRARLYGTPNNYGEWYYTNHTDGEWYVQRPKWNSNIHWIIPNNEIARKSYLRALGANGFDDVLDGVGKHFGLDGLQCFHNSFLGLSQADDSIIHTDFFESAGKSFDFLTPVLVANNSSPELDIQSQDGNVVVGVKYRYDLAANLGDWAFHKTASVDYSDTGEFRVVSSVYCADLNADNVESIQNMYAQEHPAPFKSLFDLPIKEWHWRHGQKLLPK